MRRKTIFFLLLLLVMALPLTAAGHTLPDVIQLVDGFQPEGIAKGYGSTFYYGALNGGAVFRGDFIAGQVEPDPLVAPNAGQMATGMSFDRRSNLLYVAGGLGGTLHVYNGSTGDVVAVLQLADPFVGFINDVLVTRRAIYVTDSFQAQFYRLPLGPAGRLPDPVQVEIVPLSGDFWLEPQPPAGLPEFIINANGIEATRNGNWLLIAHSFLGVIYRVNPQTGEAALVEGITAPSGDGLVLNGHKLYIVQNQNQISVAQLNRDYTFGKHVGVLTNGNFNVPTTAAKFGGALYAVNARFGEVDPLAPVPPDEQFTAVRVNLKPIHYEPLLPVTR